MAMCLAPNGDLITASAEGTISIWNALSAYKTHLGSFNDGRKIRNVICLPDGRIATASFDPVVKVWNASDKPRCEMILKGHSVAVKAMFIFEEAYLITAATDIRVWDPFNGECIKRLQGHDEVIDSLGMLENGCLISSSDRDKNVKVWDIDNGDCVATIKCECPCSSLCTLQDGGFATATAQGEISIYVLSSKIDDNLPEFRKLYQFKAHYAAIDTLIHLPNGGLLSGSADATMKLWNMNGLRPSRPTCSKTMKFHLKAVQCALILPDEENIVSAGLDRNIYFTSIEGPDIHGVKSDIESMKRKMDKNKEEEVLEKTSHLQKPKGTGKRGRPRKFPKPDDVVEKAVTQPVHRKSGYYYDNDGNEYSEADGDDNSDGSGGSHGKVHVPANIPQVSQDYNDEEFDDNFEMALDDAPIELPPSKRSKQAAEAANENPNVSMIYSLVAVIKSSCTDNDGSHRLESQELKGSYSTKEAALESAWTVYKNTSSNINNVDKIELDNYKELLFSDAQMGAGGEHVVYKSQGVFDCVIVKITCAPLNAPVARYSGINYESDGEDWFMLNARNGHRASSSSSLSSSKAVSSSSSNPHVQAKNKNGRPPKKQATNNSDGEEELIEEGGGISFVETRVVERDGKKIGAKTLHVIASPKSKPKPNQRLNVIDRDSPDYLPTVEIVDS